MRLELLGEASSGRGMEYGVIVSGNGGSMERTGGRDRGRRIRDCCQCLAYGVILAGTRANMAGQESGIRSTAQLTKPSSVI
jgi:hypothetical protein